MQFDTIISTPIGKVGIKTNGNKLLQLVISPHTPSKVSNDNKQLSSVIKKELELYFKNPKHKFAISFELEGTVLQKKIWQELTKIPSGKTVTYKSIAQKLNTSPRVVGNACRRNPIPLIVPCHRVVAVKSLGGYCGHSAGSFTKAKEWLLKHETV